MSEFQVHSLWSTNSDGHDSSMDEPWVQAPPQSTGYSAHPDDPSARSWAETPASNTSGVEEVEMGEDEFTEDEDLYVDATQFNGSGQSRGMAVDDNLGFTGWDSEQNSVSSQSEVGPVVRTGLQRRMYCQRTVIPGYRFQHE